MPLCYLYIYKDDIFGNHKTWFKYNYDIFFLLYHCDSYIKLKIDGTKTKTIVLIIASYTALHHWYILTVHWNCSFAHTNLRPGGKNNKKCWVYMDDH